jgi:GDP-L-fucose synthase
MARRIFVAGHRGMVGSALVRALQQRGGAELLLRTREELDLTDQAQVRAFFATERIDQVYLAAARVGGILANDTYRADFIYQNLAIETHLIHQAHLARVEKLLFLGSSCIYPRTAAQPMSEAALLTGPLEPTNQPYALAKIAGIEMCDAYRRQHGADFRAVMPTNLYGPQDNFDLQASHVLPALLRKFHEGKRSGAPQVTVWGSGTPRREFLHVDDLAAACLFVMDLPRERWNALPQPWLNVGCGSDISIAEAAREIREVVGYQGGLEFDRGKPDGAPRKLLDVSRLSALGWSASIPLRRGLEETYAWFLRNEAAASA